MYEEIITNCHVFNLKEGRQDVKEILQVSLFVFTPWDATAQGEKQYKEKK